jgi:hypothetical protein
VHQVRPVLLVQDVETLWNTRQVATEPSGNLLTSRATDRGFNSGKKRWAQSSA